MLFTPDSTFYSKVQFKTEEEVEQVVARNFKLLFGDYSVLLPKSLIRTSCGDGTVPNPSNYKKDKVIYIGESSTSREWILV